MSQRIYRRRKYTKIVHQETNPISKNHCIPKLLIPSKKKSYIYNAPPADNAQPVPAPTWENEQYRNQELFGLFQNNDSRQISVFSASER